MATNSVKLLVSKIPFLSRRHMTIVRQLFQHKLAIVGISSLIIMVLAALFAPIIAPYNPIKPEYQATLQEPSLTHPFGTDSFGRDIFSRVIYGAQVSVKVGLAVVFFSLSMGVPFGLISGYYSDSLIDSSIMRVMDAILAFPSIILALTIMTILGSSITNVILALSVVNIPVFARLVRGNVLSVKEEEYIMSARAVGSTDRKIIFSHVLPNVIAPIIVQATLVFAFAILNEATLSFLGIGVQPPEPSWGLMLRAGKRYLDEALWMSIFPGIAIMISVLSLNFLGDALRDVLDPKYTEDEVR